MREAVVPSAAWPVDGTTPPGPRGGPPAWPRRSWSSSRPRRRRRSRSTWAATTPSERRMGTSGTSARGTAGSGVDVDHDFVPDYVVPEDSERHVAELKRALRTADDLILATDYDREGEAIAYHVASLLGVDPATAKRVTFTEITRDAILEAFTQPRVDRPAALRRPGGAPDPRPPRGLPDLADPLEAGPPGPVGRARPVGRRPADRGARARDPRVRARSSTGASTSGSRPRTPSSPSLARLTAVPEGKLAAVARQEGHPPRRRGRRGHARRAAPRRRLPGGERRAQGAQALARRRRSRPRPCSRRPRASSGSARARR